jgi:hypothetical protein
VLKRRDSEMKLERKLEMREREEKSRGASYLASPTSFSLLHLLRRSEKK